MTYWYVLNCVLMHCMLTEKMGNTKLAKAFAPAKTT